MSSNHPVKPSAYFELRDYIKQKNKSDILNKKQVVMLEQAIFKDLMACNGKCNKCPRTENLTLDHIIPRQILELFGIDTLREILENNYQILCKTCNTFKSNRLDFSIPQTKQLLYKLLERI